MSSSLCVLQLVLFLPLSLTLGSLFVFHKILCTSWMQEVHKSPLSSLCPCLVPWEQMLKKYQLLCSLAFLFFSVNVVFLPMTCGFCNEPTFHTGAQLSLLKYFTYWGIYALKLASSLPGSVAIMNLPNLPCSHPQLQGIFAHLFSVLRPVILLVGRIIVTFGALCVDL